MNATKTLPDHVAIIMDGNGRWAAERGQERLTGHRAGARVWVRTLQAAGSYLSANDPRPHFGLGKADRVDAIHVRWPDGPADQEEVFPGTGVDREVTLTRGTGRAAQTGGATPAPKETAP